MLPTIDKKSIFPLSLTSKMAILVAEVLLITVGMSAYIGINIQKERLMKRTEKESFQFSQTIYNQLERAMLSGKRKDVQDFLNDIGNTEKIIEASVFKPNGEITFSSHTDKLYRTVKNDYLEVFDKNDIQLMVEKEGRRPTVTILTPIQNKKDCQECHDKNNRYLGALLYQPSLDWIRVESEVNSKLIILSAIITIFVSFSVIIFLMHRLVRKPISLLEQTISDVAAGDLSKRVNIESEDELGRLGKHFNTMIGQLEKTNKQLSEVHEAELLKAGKLASLGELAAGLVHEMKNPLSGISAATQILCEQYPPEDSRREIMEEMLNQVERLNKTLNDLLSFAKPTPPHLRTSDVNDVVRNVVIMTRSHAHQKNIHITEHYKENLSPVKLDPEQIKQVLLNLILNAIQSIDNNGNLTVTTSESNQHYISIAVKDNGRGILPELREKIFEPFFTTRAKGTGLGLPVSKKIVEMHGGKMEVDSEINKGTTFTVYLPKENKNH